MDNHKSFLMCTLSDMEVYTRISVMEQVTDIVRWFVLKQFPQLVWDALKMYELGEGEAALNLSHEYLESANGCNTHFLRWIHAEGSQRDT